MNPFDLILGAIAAVSGIFSVGQGAKAASAQRHAQAAQREQQNIEFAQQRRQQIREARLSMGQAENNAANQGVLTSSGYYGGQGSLQTQLDTNISFLDNEKAAADKSGSFLDKAAKWQGQSEMWKGISNIAVAGMQSGLFGGKSQPQAQLPKTPSGTMVGNVSDFGGRVGTNYFVTPSGAVMKR